MTHTDTADFGIAGLTPVPKTDSVEILRRIALPFFVFSVVLCALLTLSWFLLMPRLSRVEVGGTVRGLGEMQQHEVELRADILDAEQSRQNLILAIHEPQYLALKAVRNGRLSLSDVRSHIEAIAAQSVTQVDAVHLTRIDYDIAKKSLVIDGDVRFVGSRSMTVLAAFVDALKSDGAFATVSTPAFTREDDPVSGSHSPFSLTLTLR